MRKEDKAKYNYKRIEIYLSPKDAALFEKKAVHYKNWGPFIRDAVKQFNDIGILRRIDALNEIELAITGKLDHFYYDNLLYPRIMEIQKLICDIKDEQQQIVKKLIHR